MKPEIHPKNYRLVVFRDESANHNFITRSTVKTNRTVTVDGVEYPLVQVDISMASHPFFTGKQKLVDTAGRIDRFKKRYGRKSATSEAAPAEGETGETSAE